MIDESPCGLLALDDDRVLVEVNALAASLLGYEPGELLGRRVDPLLTRPARIFFDTHVYPLLVLQGRAEEIYLSLRSRAGEAVPVLLNAARDVGGPRPLNRLAFLPMRRRQLFERELIEARRVAEDAAAAEQAALVQVKAVQSQLSLRERLASLGTLAAGVAHEINNPLAYVSCNLEVLAESLREPAPWDAARVADLAELVAAAREGAGRIRGIIDAMRLLSRGDPDGARAPFEVAQALDLALRIASNELRHRARLEVRAGPTPRVDGDAGRLSQVLINLLVNAAQALPAGREGNLIEVTTRTAPDGAAVIEVRDNGPGIAPEHLGRVFDPFFTTKPVGEGTGLGLAVCHGIVAAMRGSLSVDSAPGEGACFRITLPPSVTSLPAPPAAPAVSSPESVAPAPAARSRVLVVDDERAVAQSLRRALTAYDVVCVNRGAEAIARVEAGERFDLVLCDLMMPGATGMDVHAAFARLDPGLAGRVVFLTGGAFTEEARAFFERVPNERLSKPFDLAALRATCARVIERGAAG